MKQERNAAKNASGNPAGNVAGRSVENPSKRSPGGPSGRWAKASPGSAFGKSARKTVGNPGRTASKGSPRKPAQGPDARLTAARTLIKLAENLGYSNILIDKALTADGLTGREAGLATGIFYGCLEKQLTLDFYIDACLSQQSKVLDLPVRVILRVAAYQILFMDKIPDFAAVDEGVAMTRRLRQPKASGFVNGVLRSLLRKKEQIARTLEEKNSLALRYGVPAELIGLWRESYGEALTGEMLAAFAQPAKTYLRVNSCKTDFEALRKEIAAEDPSMRLPGSEGSEPEGMTSVPLFPHAALLLSKGHAAKRESFLAGGYHIQDLSAQLVCALADPKPGETVYDLCAAPGGKSFTMAEMMEDRGRLFAFDLYESRVKMIRKGAERLGLACIQARVQDALALPDNLPKGDCVLCDVPCSGYGVIRRKPEIRYKALAETRALPELQYQILCHGAKLLKSSGRLIYATCTLNPAENQEVVTRFLRNHEDFIPCPMTEFESLRRWAEPSHQITLMPHAADSDGFFAAVFRKSTSERSSRAGDEF